MDFAYQSTSTSTPRASYVQSTQMDDDDNGMPPLMTRNTDRPSRTSYRSEDSDYSDITNLSPSVDSSSSLKTAYKVAFVLGCIFLAGTLALGCTTAYVMIFLKVGLTLKTWVFIGSTITSTVAMTASFIVYKILKNRDQANHGGIDSPSLVYVEQPQPYPTNSSTIYIPQDYPGTSPGLLPHMPPEARYVNTQVLIAPTVENSFNAQVFVINAMEDKILDIEYQDLKKNQVKLVVDELNTRILKPDLSKEEKKSIKGVLYSLFAFNQINFVTSLDNASDYLINMTASCVAKGLNQNELETAYNNYYSTGNQKLKTALEEKLEEMQNNSSEPDKSEPEEATDSASQSESEEEEDNVNVDLLVTKILSNEGLTIGQCLKLNKKQVEKIVVQLDTRLSNLKDDVLLSEEYSEENQIQLALYLLYKQNHKNFVTSLDDASEKLIHITTSKIANIIAGPKALEKDIENYNKKGNKKLKVALERELEKMKAEKSSSSSSSDDDDDDDTVKPIIYRGIKIDGNSENITQEKAKIDYMLACNRKDKGKKLTIETVNNLIKSKALIWDANGKLVLNDQDSD